MSLIIFVGGVPNAGKSTIVAGLAGTLPNTEFLDGDFILSEAEQSEVSQLPLPDDRWERHLEKIVVVINQKISLNRNVAIAWPLLQKGYNYVKNNIPSNIRLYCIFLNPDLASLEKNRLTRPLTEWDKNRGHEMHLENYPTQGFWDLVLDTTELLPFDTVQAIMQAMK